jgi:hypothetical protein
MSIDDRHRQNVAMVQLAKESMIVLIHIAQMNYSDDGKPLKRGAVTNEDDLIPPTLRKIIESVNTLKVGVNILGDGKRLRDFLHMKPRGMVEICDLHHRVECAINNITKVPKKLIALAKLTEMYLSLPLDKGPVRYTDWSKPASEMQMKCKYFFFLNNI